jgi:hypothetical protein
MYLRTMTRHDVMGATLRHLQLARNRCGSQDQARRPSSSTTSVATARPSARASAGLTSGTPALLGGSARQRPPCRAPESALLRPTDPAHNSAASVTAAWTIRWPASGAKRLIRQ